MKKRVQMMMCLAVAAIGLTGCSKEVEVDTDDLVNITIEGESTAKTEKEYTATLSAAENYILPENITIEIDGEELTDGYTYDSESGELTIEGEALTGEVAISAEAVMSIVGTWESVFDISELMDMAMESEPEMAEYIDFDGLNLKIVMTFDEDNNVSLVIYEDSVYELVDMIGEELSEGMYAYLEDYLAELGLDVSVEEFLEMSGMSYDELVQQLMGGFSPEDMLGMDSLGVTDGKYTIIGDTLYLDDKVVEDADPYECYPFTVEGDTLIIEASEADMEGEDAEKFDYVFPMELKRVD